MTDLSIIVVSFNTKKLTLEAIESVYKSTKGITFEVVVIENHSEDGSADSLKNFAAGKKNMSVVVNKENLGFGQGNNQGLKIAKGRYVLLLNTDTIITDNVLGEMVGWMDQNRKVGVASCSLKYRNGRIQATGGYFPTLPKVLAWMTFVDDLPVISLLLKPFHPMHDLSPLGANSTFYKEAHQMDWVTAAFLIMRRETLEDVGYFDKDYFMYMEEVDYCFRAKSFGWEVRYLPKWGITHLGGASSVKEFSLISEVKGLKIFYKKHMPEWQYPVLRLIIKVGAALRILIFGILKGGETAKIYAKIFTLA